MPEKATRATRRTYTIGLLPQLASGFGGFQDLVWKSMAVAARERGVNAFLVAGGSVDQAGYNQYEKNVNLVYDLITPDRFDGLVINYTIGNFVTRERFQEFCSGFKLPVVTIVGAVKGFPDVHVDNKTSLRELIRHLVDTHGYRNIACIRGTAGNVDAEERYAVYRETLAERGIALDPDLVFQGQFDEESGARAVAHFLGLRDKPVQAIVASNDAMAFGAINALRAAGKRVPWDVAVTGFDDTDEAPAYTPALTTVRQPFDEICGRALDLLIDRLEGRPHDQSVSIPARVMLRQSCGCSSALVTKEEVDGTLPAQPAAVVAGSGGTQASGDWAAVIDTITDEMLSTGAEQERTVLRGLVDQFICDVHGECSGSFIDRFKMLMQEKVIRNEEINLWQHALFILRRWSSRLFMPGQAVTEAENRIIQASVLVGESARQSLAYQKILLEKRFKELSAVSQDLITTFNFERLREVMQYQLVRLRIYSGYIELFNNHERPEEGSRLFLAYRRRPDGTEEPLALAPAGLALPAEAFFPVGRRYAFAVHPLCFKEYRLGYVLFEVGPEDGMVYDTLQVQLSSSLMGSELIRQLEKNEAAEKERSDKIQSLVRPMLDSLARVALTAREKIGMIGDLVSVTKDNSLKLDSTAAAIKAMGERVGKMADVIGIIDDISARVNILAINTSIESAHAGEFGKGFSVIAAEIRKLADSIQANVTVIADHLRDLRPAIDQSQKAGTTSQEAFRRLEQDVAGVAETLQSITRSMDELSEASTRILGVIDSARS